MSIKRYFITLLMSLCFIQVHDSVAMLARMPRIARYSYVNTRQSELPLKKEATADTLVDSFAKECDISESVLKEAENDPKISFFEFFRGKLFPQRASQSTEKKSEKEEPSKDIKEEARQSWFSHIAHVVCPPPLQFKNELIAGRQATLNEHSNLMQLYVANQFAFNGGSFASCGYQALKNGLFLVRALHGIHDDASLQDTLNNFARIKTLFGPLEKNDVGTWRAIIMQLRAEKAFKNYLYHNLGLKKLDAITDPITIKIAGQLYTMKKSKIHERYGTAIQDFALQAAHALTQGETDHLIIVAENIFEYIYNKVHEEEFIKSPEDFFEESLENIGRNPDHICDDADQIFKLLADYMSHRETIEKYFDINSMKSYELNLGISQEIFKYYNDNNPNPLNSDGDWLQVEEIAMIHAFEQERSPDLHQEKRVGLVHTINHGFTIIEDINDLTNTHGGDIKPEIYREIMRDMEDPLKDARDGLNDETLPEYYHIFIMSTAQRAGATRGHWFALILYKHDNIHDYIVMDSANNASRLSDERVKKVISLLENEETLVTVSEEELTKIADELKSAIKNKDAEKAFSLFEQYKELGGKEDFSQELQHLFN